MKKSLYLIPILVVACIFNAMGQGSSNLKPFDWKPISGVEKILQYEKEVKKRTAQQVELAKEHYEAAINLMNNKEYSAAITEFKAAMKNYKRAKLSPDAYNYIRVNMALCYANTGNKEDLSLATRNTNKHKK